MYSILFKDKAKKLFSNLNKDDQRRIASKLELLKNDPFPRGSIKIKGSNERSYRIRVGKYRILYSVYIEKLIITVSKIDTREGFYDNI